MTGVDKVLGGTGRVLCLVKTVFVETVQSSCVVSGCDSCVSKVLCLVPSFSGVFVWL